MELISKRYLVNAVALIPVTAPVKFTIELPFPVLEAISIITPDGAAADARARGIKVTNLGNPIYPIIGSNGKDAAVADTFFETMQGYAPIFSSGFPQWVKLHKELTSPPRLEFAIVDAGAAARIYEVNILIVCGPVTPVPVVYGVIPMAEVIAAMANPPQNENVS